MTLRDQRLLYSDLLLHLIRGEIDRGCAWSLSLDPARLNALCDRFERVLAAIQHPLVWNGDNE